MKVDVYFGTDKIGYADNNFLDRYCIWFDDSANGHTFERWIDENGVTRDQIHTYIEACVKQGALMVDLLSMVGPAVPLETRSTSATGGEKGVKPQRHALIPRNALDTISEVYYFGEQKYAPHNWRKGYEWSKSYDALQRHLVAWWDRDEVDTESGLSHLAHAGFHLFALIVFSKNSAYVQYDDRYKAE